MRSGLVSRFGVGSSWRRSRKSSTASASGFSSKRGSYRHISPGPKYSDTTVRRSSRSPLPLHCRTVRNSRRANVPRPSPVTVTTSSTPSPVRSARNRRKAPYDEFRAACAGFRAPRDRGLSDRIRQSLLSPQSPRRSYSTVTESSGRRSVPGSVTVAGSAMEIGWSSWALAVDRIVPSARTQGTPNRLLIIRWDCPTVHACRSRLVVLHLDLPHVRVLWKHPEASGHGASLDHETPDPVNPRTREFGAPASVLLTVRELELSHRHSLTVHDLVRLEQSGVGSLRRPDLVHDRLIIACGRDLPVDAG